MKTQTILTAHPSTKEQVALLKALLKELKINFEFKKEKPYNPEFVAKIEKSRQDFKDGNYVTVEKRELGKFLGLNE